MFKNTIIKGTFILTIAGFLTRFIGFFFRMFLSQTFGAEQVGLYQLIFPIYALCFSLSSAGIETSLSRSVARKISHAQKQEANSILYQAMFISISISLLLGGLMRKYAVFLSIYILGDLRCAPLLTTLSYTFPFASVHSCIAGYYLGQKQTKVPAISQFVEQIVRVGAVYILCFICQNRHAECSIEIAVLGIVIGEIISSLFCLRYFFYSKRSRISVKELWESRYLGKELIVLATPLTATRILTNLLQSVENISIPISLQKFGYSNSEALSIYGVLTGMVLPCILFPSALTNSVSTMLLPTVAEIQATDNNKKLNILIRKVVLFGFIFGAVCGILFLFLGSMAGTFLFDNTLAGNFIQTLAWICPFLYLNNTLISIINGLGKTSTSLLINVCSLTIRICGVLFGIPRFGMEGYLWGLLASQLTVTISCLTLLKLYCNKKR